MGQMKRVYESLVDSYELEIRALSGAIISVRNLHTEEGSSCACGHPTYPCPTIVTLNEQLLLGL